MKPDIKHAYFQGNLVVVGFGSIGQGMLPLLLRHFRICPEQIKIISATEDGAKIAAKFRVPFMVRVLTEDHYLPMWYGSRLPIQECKLLNSSPCNDGRHTHFPQY